MVIWVPHITLQEIREERYIHISNDSVHRPSQLDLNPHARNIVLENKMGICMLCPILDPLQVIWSVVAPREARFASLSVLWDFEETIVTTKVWHESLFSPNMALTIPQVPTSQLFCILHNIMNNKDREAC